MILELIKHLLRIHVALITGIPCDSRVSNVEVHIHVQVDVGMGLVRTCLGDSTMYLEMRWASSLTHDRRQTNGQYAAAMVSS